MNLNRYSQLRYVDRGRDIAVGVDCYGYFRHRAIEHYHWPESALPLFGWVGTGDSAAMNSAECSVRHDLVNLPRAAAGAMACVFDRDNNFQHIGIVEVVDGALSVSHMGSRFGFEIHHIRAFERAHQLSGCRVEYRTYHAK